MDRCWKYTVNFHTKLNQYAEINQEMSNSQHILTSAPQHSVNAVYDQLKLVNTIWDIKSGKCIHCGSAVFIVPVQSS